MEDLTTKIKHLTIQAGRSNYKIEQLTRKVQSLEKELRDNKSKAKGKEKTNLKIGDRVKIRNPSSGQANSGRVCRVGTEYITVNTKKGKVVRKIRNLQKVKSSSEQESIE